MNLKYHKIPKEIHTEEELDELIAFNNEVREHNNNVRQYYAGIRRQLLELAKEAYGEKSNMYKYITKYRVHNYPTPTMVTTDDLQRRYKQTQDEKMKQERAIERAERHEEITKQAIEYCISHNLKWTPSTAYDAANNHYLDTEIASREGKEVYLKHACDCGKWIAGERRCSCGNRRIYWNTSMDYDFRGKGYLYPTPD